MKNPTILKKTGGRTSKYQKNNHSNIEMRPSDLFELILT